MEKFLNQLLSQIVIYFTLVTLMLFTIACLLTGEFPPKIESVRAEYQNILELKKSSGLLLKMAAEKLKTGEKIADTNPAHVNSEQTKDLLTQQNALSRQMGEIQQEQVHLRNRMDVMIQQNYEIIKLLNKNQK